MTMRPHLTVWDDTTTADPGAHQCPDCRYEYTGTGARLAAQECCWWDEPA